MTDATEELVHAKATENSASSDVILASNSSPPFQNPENMGAAAHQGNRKKTGGEKLFDRVVYTGIGFGVNEASSLWITAQFLHGKNLLKSAPEPMKKIGNWFSREGYEKISDMLVRAFKITDKIVRNEKGVETITARARAGNGLLMVTLLSGGTLLILPMRWLENSKAYWVKKANHWLDGNKLSEEDAAKRDAEVEQAIACSPQQSWGSLLLGRVVACASSVCTGMFLVGPKRNERLSDISENIFTGGRGVKPNNEKGVLRGMARIGLVETYSCAISSIVLEVASKFFAKAKPKPRAPEICTQEKAVASNDLPTPPNDSGSEAVKNIISRKPSASYVENLAAENAQPMQSIGMTG